MDIGLYYPNVPKEELIGYVDAGYVSDPHNARSQTGYLFTCGDTAISWRSTKQSIIASSSNHAEILAIHEASRECFWLRSVIHHIRRSCGLSFSKEVLTTLYEDNAACIVQLKNGYICDAPNSGCPLTTRQLAKNSICLVSRDSFMSKMATWAHTSILINIIIN